jgi:hypothetical protein
MTTHVIGNRICDWHDRTVSVPTLPIRPHPDTAIWQRAIVVLRIVVAYDDPHDRSSRQGERGCT